MSTFFTELKLQGYTAAVAENEVDGLMLEELVAADGLSDLGVTTLHAIRIKRALKVAADDIAQTSCASVGADDGSGPTTSGSGVPAVANSCMHLVRTLHCLLCAWPPTLAAAHPMNAPCGSSVSECRCVRQRDGYGDFRICAATPWRRSGGPKRGAAEGPT